MHVHQPQSWQSKRSSEIVRIYKIRNWYFITFFNATYFIHIHTQCNATGLQLSWQYYCSCKLYYYHECRTNAMIHTTNWDPFTGWDERRRPRLDLRVVTDRSGEDDNTFTSDDKLDRDKFDLLRSIELAARHTGQINYNNVSNNLMETSQQGEAIQSCINCKAVSWTSLLH